MIGGLGDDVVGWGCGGFKRGWFGREVRGMGDGEMKMRGRGGWRGIF